MCRRVERNGAKAMTVVVVQMGHVARKTGRTGTFREQELTRKIGNALRTRLVAAGHKAHLMGADDPLPVAKGDVFVALHGDSGNAKVAGRGQSSKRGASVGFPKSDQGGGRLGKEWKTQHAKAGFPGGFLADNNTVNMTEYYMWDRTGGFRHRYLAEHATLTNSADEEWIFAHIQVAAAAHVAAIEHVLGTAGGPKPNEYVVKKGDTLIKIGRQFGLEFQAIAKRNGITAPFTIFPGQVLAIPR
jgi:nucleoid-associated protein YgaU